MRIRAYAVVCKVGEVHADAENCFVFLDKAQAQDSRHGDTWDLGADDQGCGPHKVITLSGEWSPPRRPRSRLKFNPRDLAILGGDPSL